MFGVSKVFSSVILVVIFLALASLAAFLYNSDQAGQAEVINSSLAQKGTDIFNVVLDVSGGVADSNLEKNTGFGDKIVDVASTFIKETDWEGLISGKKKISDSSSDLPAIKADDGTPGFFSKLITAIKDEWQKIKEERGYYDNGEAEIFNVKTEAGSEMSSESGSVE